MPQEYRDFGRMWDDAKKQQICKLKVLIIDEVSMLSGEMLDSLDRGIRNVR